MPPLDSKPFTERKNWNSYSEELAQLCYAHRLGRVQVYTSQHYPCKKKQSGKLHNCECCCCAASASHCHLGQVGAAADRHWTTLETTEQPAETAVCCKREPCLWKGCGAECAEKLEEDY